MLRFLRSLFSRKPKPRRLGAHIINPEAFRKAWDASFPKE